MSRDIILDIFCKFCLQKKRGFTLAEALIITVMTAFCLLPILGTMQNGQILTQKYDHKLKMRQIARSRLNWLSVDENDYAYINGAKKSDLKRSNHGVCSFGDEIFIFGGEINNDRNSQAISNIAINPETKVVRRLTSLPLKLTNCDAVVYGSKIYVIGMNFEHNLTFYEYTP